MDKLVDIVLVILIIIACVAALCGLAIIVNLTLRSLGVIL